MPTYIFKHPTKELYKEIVMAMSEYAPYSEKGLQWQRVFTAPKISTSGTRLDPYSEADFLNKTANMKGTVGDMWDLSEEMALKRQDKDGVDQLSSNYQKQKEDKIKKKRLEARQRRLAKK